MSAVIDENFEFVADLNKSGKCFKVRPAGDYKDQDGKVKNRKFSIFISDSKGYISLSPVEVLVLARALQDEKLKEQMTLRAKAYINELNRLI